VARVQRVNRKMSFISLFSQSQLLPIQDVKSYDGLEQHNHCTHERHHHQTELSAKLSANGTRPDLSLEKFPQSENVIHGSDLDLDPDQ
jgi:hypothetical protein